MEVNIDQTFVVGDWAVYPAHGVAEIVALEARDIAGANTDVYVLKIIDSGVQIMVPTANTEVVGLRGIMSEGQAREVYSVLRTKQTPRDGQSWNRRYREYRDKIKTGDVIELAEVLRDLCTLRTTKELSFGERRVLESVRGLLVKELALAEESSEDAVLEEIEGIFSKVA